MSPFGDVHGFFNVTSLCYLILPYPAFEIEVKIRLF